MPCDRGLRCEETTPFFARSTHPRPGHRAPFVGGVCVLVFVVCAAARAHRACEADLKRMEMCHAYGDLDEDGLLIG